MKTLFMDLDHTLIEPNEGRRSPIDKNDWRFRKYALESLVELYELGYRRLYIITNQGGIPDYMSPLQFHEKITKVVKEIEVYFSLYYDFTDTIRIDYFVAVGMKHPGRKPNPYFFHMASNKVGILDPKDCLMVGDMAGGDAFIDGKTGEDVTPGDSDIMFAKNAQMKFMHIDDLLNQTKKIYESKTNK
jgi:DNA 3'-phosphatase